MAKLIIIFFASLFCAQCLIYQTDKKELNITFQQMKSEFVGKIGTAMASFRQEPYVYHIDDTEKKPCFESIISNGKEDYNVKCGLWSKDLSSEVIIFCNIESNIPSGDYYILLNETNTFTYKDYDVTLQNCDKVKFTKLEKNIIDLYSNSQSIQINDGVDSYELRFNIVSYNQEPLFANYLPLDNCRTENNILICTIAKSDILAYLTTIDSEVIIDCIDKNNNITYFPLIPIIKINMKGYPKKDIFVGIKKLLSNVNGCGAYIAYETDVTDVSNFYNFGNSQFSLPFMKKENETAIEVKIYCSFVKYENNPLFLLCKMENEGTFWLKEIEQEKKVKDYNIQYNYRIQPVKNEEPIQIKGDGRFIIWSYPRVLDFTKTNDPLYVQYGSLDHLEYLKGLTFNEKEKDLECQLINGILKCDVSKSHFNGEKNGFYFLKHTSTNANKIISYEVRPIKVILENHSKGKISSVSINYLILFILLLI